MFSRRMVINKPSQATRVKANRPVKGLSAEKRRSKYKMNRNYRLGANSNGQVPLVGDLCRVLPAAKPNALGRDPWISSKSTQETGAYAFRHTYRTLLDDLGTPIGVQQKLMRHSDVRTTMDLYGSAYEKTKRRAQYVGGRQTAAGNDESAIKNNDSIERNRGNVMGERKLVPSQLVAQAVSY